MARSLTLFSLVLLLASAPPSPAASLADRPRLLVLTDIGGNPEAEQSLIRLLLYANEFELEGFIATASGTPGEHVPAPTQPALIRGIIAAYGQVYGRLTNHALGYPQPGELLARVRSGNPERGRAAIGEDQDTEGSRYLIELGDRPDPRPLDVALWGGQTDLAQACWRVRQDRGVAGLRTFLARLRVYDNADQDSLAAWLTAEFDFPFYLLNKAFPGFDPRAAAAHGMYLIGEESLVSREWMERNLRQNHGPLGALYPPHAGTAPNPHFAIKEGDTPSWFYFLRHGVNDPHFPNWGGWGGRFERDPTGVWRDAPDRVQGITDARWTVARWRRAFQNDFAARMDWCGQPFGGANHPPHAVLNGDWSRDVVHLPTKSGQPVRLDASRSLDPDGDRLSYRWWQYWEAGTWKGELSLAAATQPLLEFKAPTVTDHRTIHLVLEVTDNGAPELTAYRRVILEIDP